MHFWISHQKFEFWSPFQSLSSVIQMFKPPVNLWWHFPQGIPCGSAGKESTCNVGDLGSIPGLGRSPGEGKGYPLQYSGLENSMDCVVHGVTRVGHDWVTFTFTFPLYYQYKGAGLRSGLPYVWLHFHQNHLVKRPTPGWLLPPLLLASRPQNLLFLVVLQKEYVIMCPHWEQDSLPLEKG